SDPRFPNGTPLSKGVVMKASLTSAGALFGVLLASSLSSAQHPQPCASPAPPTYGYTTPYLSQPCGVPQAGGHGLSCSPGAMPNGGNGVATCGVNGYGPAPYDPCCKEPGYCKRFYDSCMGRIKGCAQHVSDSIHSCLSSHHQITSPVFPTHPFARSPRDYFMLD